MAFQHGRSTVFKLDDSGGTLRDLSAFLTSVDFPQAVDIPDTTAFGDTARKRGVVGLKDNNFSFSGMFDPTAITGPDAILSGALGTANTVSFEYGPEGGTTGKVKYSGEGRLTSYDLSSPVDGICTFSANGVVDGAVTRGTFA